MELSWLSWSRTHARSSADRGAMPRRRRRRVAQGPQAPDVGTVGGGELTPGVQGGEADLPSQPLRNRRRGNLIRAAGELEELQSESKLNRGCEYCGWWHANSPFPFPNCNLCGARPSYHHGRCRPQRPRNPTRLCPFGTSVDSLPASKEGKAAVHSRGSKTFPGTLAGYHPKVEGQWSGDLYVVFLSDIRGHNDYKPHCKRNTSFLCL